MANVELSCDINHFGKGEKNITNFYKKVNKK
jgi:hypothetical protein